MEFIKNYNEWLKKQFEIVDFCNDFLNPFNKLKLFFRGEPQLYETTLTPSLYRNEELPWYINNIYSEVYSKYCNEFHDDNNSFDKLVRMQHFNIPTKLLDVTEDPYVALYFATKNKNSNGKVYCFFISNNSIVYPQNPLSVILSCNYNYPSKASVFENKFDFDIIREINKIDELELTKEKMILNQNFNLAFNYAFYNAKKDIVFDKSLYMYFDLVGTFLAIPYYNNPRIVKQKGALLLGGLTYEDSLFKNLFHFNDVDFMIRHLKDESIADLIKDIYKKTFADKKCQEFLIDYLKNFMDKNIFDVDEYNFSFSLETLKELHTNRTKESPLYLEYLLFLYGIYGFMGKFSFYNDIVVLEEEKEALIKTLCDFNGISERNLFPDLEHFGYEIKERFKL